MRGLVRRTARSIGRVIERREEVVTRYGAMIPLYHERFDHLYEAPFAGASDALSMMLLPAPVVVRKRQCNARHIS